VAGCVAVLVLLLSAPVQQARPTVVVYNFTTQGHSRDPQLLASMAARATRHLVLTLSRDTTIELMQRRPKLPGGRPAAARHAVVASLRETPDGGTRIYWQLLSVEDLRIITKDSVETAAGREPETAGIIAQRVSALLRPTRVP
jgi:hypothetical protein